MKIKRFTGPNMRTVMRDIREVFGPDAVILESGRGADGLEVTAAMDFDPAELDRAPRPVANAGAEAEARPAPGAGQIEVVGTEPARLDCQIRVG